MFRRKPAERGEFDDIFDGIKRLEREGVRLHVMPNGSLRVDRRDIAKFVKLKLRSVA